MEDVYSGVLALIGLNALMEMSQGRSDLVIGIADGPANLSTFIDVAANVRTIGPLASHCYDDAAACLHGTSVASVLVGRVGGNRSISPNCKLLFRPIFTSTKLGRPTTTPEELAAAVIDLVDGGAQAINLSVGLASHVVDRCGILEMALDWAMARHVIVVAAAGNQGAVLSTSLTRHPWVIPVASCDERGHPCDFSNLSSTISKNGLLAPAKIPFGRHPQSFFGTSTSTVVVTGAVALLWSLFPLLSGVTIRRAMTRNWSISRRCIVPPLLDGLMAYNYCKLESCG